MVLQLTELFDDDGSPTENNFKTVPTEIGAEEADEVGGVGGGAKACLFKVVHFRQNF